jgi:hypothetical protein
MNHTPPALLGLAGLVVGVGVVVVGVVGCADAQLGQAEITAPCAGSDADCDPEDVRAPVAAGARFDVEVAPAVAGALAVPLTLHPVDVDVVTVEDGVLKAVGPGLTAVLLLTDDGSAVDVIHVTVQKPERLTLHRSLNDDVVVDERPLPAAVQVFPGEELTLKLNVWSGAQALAGDADDAWSVDNPAFRLIDQGFGRERRLRAPDEAGSANVVVTVASGLSVAVRLEVVQ